MITYNTNQIPDIQTISDLYRIAPLNRPIDDLPRLKQMYENANLILAAHHNREQLVGILRAWHDNARDGYICDLAVHPDFQKRGIGARLLELARENRPQIQWILQASKIAVNYYEHIGWKKIDNGWYWPRTH